MASLLNFNETPNLLELVESYRSDLPVVWGLSESASCDEKTHGVAAAGGTGISLIDLSLCADEGSDDAAGLTELQSVCADEGPDPA